MRGQNKETGEIVTIIHGHGEVVFYDQEWTEEELLKNGYSKFDNIHSEHYLPKEEFTRIYNIIKEECEL